MESMINHYEFADRERQEIIKALQENGPLTNREIQMICFLGEASASRQIQKLLEDRKIEHVKAQKIVNLKLCLVPTKYYKISPKWKAGLDQLGRR